MRVSFGARLQYVVQYGIFAIRRSQSIVAAQLQLPRCYRVVGNFLPTTGKRIASREKENTSLKAYNMR